MELAVRDERLTLRVGTVTLAALAAFAVFQLVFDGCRQGDRFPVTVYFAHLGGLAEDADVQVAGRVIGQVESIYAVPAHMTRPGHLLYPLGGVAVRLGIERARAYMTTKNAEIFISNKGMFGQRYLEVGVPLAGAERERPLRAGDEVRGVDPPIMDRVLTRSYRNIEIARRFMAAIRPEWDELTEALGQLALTLTRFEVLPAAVALGESLDRLSGQARALGAKVAESGVTGATLAQLMSEAQVTSARLDQSMTEVRARLRILQREIDGLRTRIPDDLGQRLERLLTTTDESLARVQGLVVQVREIAASVRRGEGTVGAIWNDPEFPEHAKELGRIIKRRPWKLFGTRRQAGAQ